MNGGGILPLDHRFTVNPLAFPDMGDPFGYGSKQPYGIDGQVGYRFKRQKRFDYGNDGIIILFPVKRESRRVRQANFSCPLIRTEQVPQEPWWHEWR